VKSERFFLLAVLVIVTATAALHIVGSMPSLSWMWGVHFYAFYAPGSVWLATLLLAVACGLVWMRRERLAAAFERASLSGRRLIIAVAIVTIGMTAAFWAARSVHTYLGDGNVLVINLPTGQSFHERQPLTMFLQQMIYRATESRFEAQGRSIEDVAQDAAAAGSVLTGLFFLIVSWFLSRELVRLAGKGSSGPGAKPAGGGGKSAGAAPARGGDAKKATAQATGGNNLVVLLVWLVLLAQGYVQLFFGYVENYSFFTVGIALYLWAALYYLRGGVPLIVPGVALLLGIALHLSMVVMVPSFFALALWGVWRAGRRGKTLVDVGLFIVGFIGLQIILNAASPGYSLIETLKEVTGLVVTRRQEGIQGYMFSPHHFRDFFNEQLLIGPLGLWLFLPAAVMALAARRRVPVAVWILMIAGLAYLAATWVAGDSNLGYARNWDLLAPAGLVFTVAALAAFLALGGIRAAWAALVCALLVSLFHTVPWVGTNASSGRSLARLKTLPLDFGRTEVLVSQWYRRAGDSANQLVWLEKAVERAPYNNNAQYLLGLYHFERNEFDVAAKAFANAATLRPDKVLFRQYLVQCLMRLGRLPEAIPHLEFLVEKEPNQVNNWILYAEALKQADRPEDAQKAFEGAEPIYKRLLEADPDDYATNLGYGWILFNLKRYEEALGYFEKAHEVNPDSADAVCYIGHTLRQLGRVDEAIENFSRCLAIKPDHADREEIVNWADSIGRKVVPDE